MVKKITSLYTVDNIFYFSIFLFGLYPLVPGRYESYVPILFIVASFSLFITTKKKEKTHYRLLIIMSSIFLMFLTSALLSDDLYSGFKKIETMMSLIGFPIACFWFLKDIKLDFERIQNILFKTFFTSTVVFSLIALYLLRFYRHPKFSLRDADFFRNAITDIPVIGDHSIYISLFLAIAIIMGLFIYVKKSSTLFLKIILVIGTFIMVIMLLLLMSKSIISALIFSFLSALIMQRKISKNIIIGGAIIIVLGIMLLPKQNNRFVELFDKDSYSKLDMRNSTSIRFYALKSSIELAFDNPIFGYGLGDVQKELDSKYELTGINLPTKGFNSHNQYLFVWLSSGIFGLILFLYYLFYIFKIAIKQKDHFLFCIIILFMISFLFENVLSRQSGVILFSFLINLLILKNVTIKKTQNGILQ